MHPIRQGDTGPAVAEVREALIALGLLGREDHAPAAEVYDHSATSPSGSSSSTAA